MDNAINNMSAHIKNLYKMYSLVPFKEHSLFYRESLARFLDKCNIPGCFNDVFSTQPPL